MKKVLPFVLCLLPLSLFAAGVEPEPHQVFLNGKPFARAVFAGGVWLIPLEDIAKASGNAISLEPGLHIQGSTLRVEATITHRKAGKGQQEFLIVPNRDGVITNNLKIVGGKRLVPLTDFAHALGTVWTPPAGKVAPGATFQLNFAKNPNAILIGL